MKRQMKNGDLLNKQELKINANHKTLETALHSTEKATTILNLLKKIKNETKDAKAILLGESFLKKENPLDIDIIILHKENQGRNPECVPGS